MERSASDTSALEGHRTVLLGGTARMYITVACFLLGLLAVMQLRTQTNLARTQAPSLSDQAEVISNLVESNANLRKEITRLENQVDKFGQGSGAELDALIQELQKLRAVTGESDVSGPGVEVWLSRDISVPDMQDLINELRNAGSESIAINSRRIIGQSSVTGGEDAILIDGHPVKAPFVMHAIGDADTLERAIERKGGLVSLLRVNYPGLTVRVTKYEKLILPPRPQHQEFTFTQRAS